MTNVGQIIVCNNSRDIAKAMEDGSDYNFGRMADVNMSNMKVGPVHAAKLGEAMCQSYSLKTVNLASNRLGQGGLRALADKLKKYRGQPITLELSSNQIDDGGAEELAHVVEALGSRLRRLLISSNPLGTRGVKKVLKAVKGCPALVELNLYNCGIGDGVGAVLRDMLESMTPPLEQLYIGRNKLSDADGVLIATGLVKNATLTGLNISSTRVGAKTFDTLLEVLPSNRTIQNLWCSNTAMPRDAPEKIRRILSGSTRRVGGPLIDAVASGVTVKVQAILSADRMGLANIERTDTNATPLILAVSLGYEDIALLLLDYGVNVAAEDSEGRSALLIACMLGLLEIIPALIQAGADVNAVHGPAKWTPLAAAAARGKTDVVKLLVWSKASTRSPCLGVDPPLYYAAANGFTDTVHQLIVLGADVNEQPNDLSPLHVAAALGRDDVVRLLIENKANVNSKSSKTFVTPLSLSKNVSKHCYHLLSINGAIPD